jgi:ribonucleoside-triphosphate reductase
MINNYSYPDEFKNLINSIQKKYKDTDLLELDGIGKQLDFNEFSRKFFNKNEVTSTSDISIDANANVEDVTVLQYNSEITKPIHRLNSYFLLWKYARQLFNAEIAEKMVSANLSKEIYINDFHLWNLAYCFNFSAMDVVCCGLPFTKKVKSLAPNNLSSFMGQMINFITYAGNNIAGAVGLSDLLICASWYVEKLRREYKNIDKNYLDKQIKQEIQSFIYSVNQPFRGGLQSFFLNLTIFDDIFLTKLCDEYIFPDGKKVSMDTVKELQEIYVNLMNEILSISPATFPITTAAFAVDEDKKIKDINFLKFMAKNNMKYGFMNIYAGKTSTICSCCRLKSDTNNEYFNNFGSGSAKIGSIGVVTINLPRIAYHSKSREDFLERVQELTELASKINHTKRHIIKKRVDNGYYPLYSLGYMNLKRQYSTCGLVGINETCEVMKCDILTKEGQEFVTDILDIINKVNSIQEKKYKYPHNVEQVPAENSAIKLALADKELGYNTKYSIYSNQFIPLTTNADILERMKLQGLFDKHMTGGAICHLNIVDEIKDEKFMEKLIKQVIEVGVIYFAINYNLQECKNSHLTVGKSNKCSICGENIINNYSRVVGFLVNTKNFHKVRREKEYPERQFYKKEELDKI